MNSPDHAEQLNRIESKVDRVVARVDMLERRASFWGAVAAILMHVVTNLGGCV